MAIDEALFRLNYKDDALPAIRFYCWQKPTVSLGYFQETAKEINLDACSSLGIDLVRRPTGGKAVLHGCDLTYAVVAKDNNKLFSKDIIETYKTISQCIAEGLYSLGINAVMAEEPRKEAPPSLKNYCFSSPSRYELLVDGKKICGSAQARSHGVFLQHGSLLLDFNARECLSVLKSCENDPEQAESLFDSVTSICHCTGSSYKIKALDMQARLVDQVAQVQVSQSFVNTGSRQLEVSFIFPLPYDGAIESMTLMVDGKEFPARLLNAEEARRLYEEIVRKNRDPALLEWMGTGLFRTSVFPVPPGQERTVSLRYSQLLRKQEGLTDFLFPLSTAKYTSHPVEKVNFRVTIESEEPIKNVYSPTHEVSIKRPDSRHATVSYKAEKEIPSADFRLLYDVGQGKVSTRVISYRPESGEDGYFLLLASPEIKASDDEPAKKTVLFVLDRSGSMSGKKIEQARAAAKFLVENLRQGDLFNMIAYDSAVEAFRPELQRYDSKSRQAALGFVEGIYAGGSTNINEAMTAALGQLQDSSRPSYVLFLSDGLPTTGVTSEAQIVANARKANQVRARTFCFGVGYDVNSRLLDKLARDSNGYTEYVRPDEDIEDRVSRLYRRIESPVMTDVEIAFEFDDKESSAKPVNRLYPKQPFDLFAGDQLVVVGRYKQSGAAKVTVRGSVGGESQKFDFSARLVKHSDDQGNAFIEKLWAIRRVGEIIDELDLNGRNEELVEELVRLSTRHGILTPYTSFLADENVNLHDTAANAASARSRLSLLEDNTSGQAGFEQRAYKGSLQRADRFSGMGGYPASAPALSAEGLVNSVYDPAATPGQSAGGGLGVQAGQRIGTGQVSGPGAPGMPGQSMYGSSPADAAQTERSAAVAAVQQIGSKTFFRRNNQWVDSTVTEKQQQNVRRVKQFSDDYFALARRHGRDLAQYLAMDDPVMVNIEGEAWLIEP